MFSTRVLIKIGLHLKGQWLYSFDGQHGLKICWGWHSSGDSNVRTLADVWHVPVSTLMAASLQVKVEL